MKNARSNRSELRNTVVGLIAVIVAVSGLVFWPGCAFDTEEEDVVLPPIQTDGGCTATQDDASPEPAPVTDELPGHGIVVPFYVDADGDGYGGTSIVYAPLGTTSLPGASNVGGDCDDSNPDVHPGAAEVCNGKDDNCDGQTDEGTECAACPGGPIMPYYRDVDGDGYGNASVMQMMCSGLGATGWVDIAGDCDDSDPAVHENCECESGTVRSCYSGPAGTKDIGLCQAGTQTCVSRQWGACADEVLPQTEVCDGLDHDCDGTAGTGCECVNGATQECYSGPAGTKDVGLCQGGTQTCESGQWGACQGEALPQTEVCGDGLDQNCDGTADEGCLREVEVTWSTPGLAIAQYINLYGCWGYEAPNGAIVCEGPGTSASWGVLVNEKTNAQCVVANSATLICKVWVAPGKVLRMNAQYGVSSQLYGCNVPQYGGCTGLPGVRLVATGTALSVDVKYGPGMYDANWQVLVP